MPPSSIVAVTWSNSSYGVLCWRLLGIGFRGYAYTAIQFEVTPPLRRRMRIGGVDSARSAYLHNRFLRLMHLACFAYADCDHAGKKVNKVLKL